MEKINITGIELKQGLKVAGQFLEDNKEKINALNVFPVPDGDTGTNMSLTMKSAVNKSSNTDSESISEIMLAASQGSLMGARGNSGVILSQLFRGFAIGFKDKDVADVDTLAAAFKEAANTAYKAVMKPTEGTILTVAREMGEKAEELKKRETDVLVFLEKVIEHGNEALAKTQDMLPVLKEAGVVDAGGKGLMTIVTGIYNSLSGIEIVIIENNEEEQYKDVVEHKFLDTEDIKFSYCTEFMVNCDMSDLELEQFRNYLANLGDSLMAVKGEGLTKVHVHTNNPGKAIEKALTYGYLSDLKIDNMKLQYEKVKEEKKKVDKKYSFVAVSTGEGIDKIFEDMNVDQIVTGGQTMNPSTEDIVKAIEKTSGENVFILPNNSNIILAAEQSKNLCDRNIIVLPTKTIPQGITAIFSFDEGASPEENESQMLEAIGDVKSGQLTYAVRDSEVNGTKIEKDDFIGLLENKIVVSGSTKEIAIDELIEKMVDEDSSLITIIYGEEISEDEVSQLEDKLVERYPDLDIEVLHGGQPIYYYIISVE